MTAGTKKCPFCAETIKAEAIVCRFCGRDLAGTGLAGAQPVTVSPTKPQRKRSFKGIGILLILAFLFLLWAMIKTGGSPSPDRVVYRATATAVRTSHNVVYKITGTAARVSLTYNNEQEGTEQTEVNTPWEKKFSVKPGTFLYVSAQNQGESGSVTCEIWVDGDKWKTSTSSGAYKIATCSGSAGGD